MVLLKPLLKELDSAPLDGRIAVKRSFLKEMALEIQDGREFRRRIGNLCNARTE